MRLGIAERRLALNPIAPRALSLWGAARRVLPAAIRAEGPAVAGQIVIPALRGGVRLLGGPMERVDVERDVPAADFGIRGFAGRGDVGPRVVVVPDIEARG
jgi:hypothetical protein